MDIFRKTLAVILAILFVIAGVAALFLFNLESRAFSAKSYQQVFTDRGFYERLPIVIAGALDASTSSQLSELPIAMRGLSVNGWEAFVRSMLPPDMLKAIGDDALGSVFAYLNQERDSASISLALLKTNMTGDAGVQAVLTLLKTQPDCTLDQIAGMAFAALQSQEIQFCNPPAELQPVLVPVIQLQMQVTASVLPDEIILIKAQSDPAQTDPRARLKIVRLFMRLSPILPIGLLLLVTLLAVRSLRNWLDWWGIPFAITGFSAVVLASLGGPVVRLALQQVLVRSMPTYMPVVLLDYASDMAATMAREFTKPVIWQGLALGILGLAMILVSFFQARRNRMMAQGNSEAKTMV
jgi:hypothetical protein